MHGNRETSRVSRSNQETYFLFSVAIVQGSELHVASSLASPAALEKPVRLSLAMWAGEPQRGDLTNPG
jgi:hypothetical protein